MMLFMCVCVRYDEAFTYLIRASSSRTESNDDVEDFTSFTRPDVIETISKREMFCFNYV